jgi:tetratricopeptide (TPR) repeat protein
MKKIILLLPLFYFTAALSQNYTYNRDSLFVLLKQSKSPVEQIHILEDIGDFYLYAGQYDSSSLVYQKTLQLATDFQIDSLLARAYVNLASIFSNLGDYKQSLEFNFKGISIAQKSKSIFDIYYAFKQTAVTYKVLKNYPEALKYLRKSEPFLQQSQNRYQITLNRHYSHMAEIFLGLGQMDSALRYVQSANEVTSKDNDAFGFARTLYIFATVYKAKGDADLAESYYKKCIAFSDSEKFALPYVTATTGYGQYLLNTGQNNLSRQYALAGFSKAKQTKNKLGVINAAALLRSAYLALGQRDSSYFYADIKDVYRDSVFNEQQVNQIQNLSFSQQIKEKEDEAKLSAEAEQRKQNIQYALIAFGIIIFIIIFLFFSTSFAVAHFSTR